MTSAPGRRSTSGWRSWRRAGPARPHARPARRRGDLGHRRRPARTPRALERLPAGSRYVVSPTPMPGGASRVRGRGLHGLHRRADAPGERPHEPARPRPAARPRRGRSGSDHAAAATATDSILLRLAAFAALAAFAVAHWAAAPARRAGRPPPARRARGDRRRGRAPPCSARRARCRAGASSSLAARIVVATLAVGLMAAGLAGRLLLPAAGTSSPTGSIGGCPVSRAWSGPTTDPRSGSA